VIHSTAIIDPKAELADDVIVGPYSMIGPGVTIDSGTEIGPHVVIKGPTTIGKHNKIFQFSSIGEDPQDLRFEGEDVRLEIGDHNTIRESCTLNRGTAHGGGLTRLGDYNLLMAYVHLGHDCFVGNHVVMANNATLAGHVIVEDHAVLGGLSAVHQFCHIGTHSFASGGSMIAKDVPPYVKVSGYYAKPFGLNSVGLARKGFSSERLAQIKKIYKIIYRQNLTAKEAIESIKALDYEDAPIFLNILEKSERGIVR
jgi:UDP-N-acetylglucosamine acyltransferase